MMKPKNLIMDQQSLKENYFKIRPVSIKIKVPAHSLISLRSTKQKDLTILMESLGWLSIQTPKEKI